MHRFVHEPLDGGRLRRHAWRATGLTLCAYLVYFSIHLLSIALNGGISFGADFNGDLYQAGLRLSHGLSPYDPALLQHQASIVLNHGTFTAIPSPRYPVPILLLTLPLSLLPLQLAEIVFLIAAVGAVLLALWWLGVRDWRCVVLTLLSAPVVTGVLVGNLSPFMFLGAAAAWRYRRHVLPTAAAVGTAVMAKLFLWPIGVWLLMTRRFRAFAIAAGGGLLLGAIAWAAVGFAGLAQYPHLLMNVATVGEGRGSSLVAFLIYVGFDPELARALAIAGGLSVIALAWAVHRRTGDEARAFGLVLMASLMACPVVWGHYLVLMYVPIALLSPRLSYLWFLPMLSAFAPGEAAHAYGIMMAPVLFARLWLVWKLSLPLFEESRSARRLLQLRARVATASAAAPS